MGRKAVSFLKAVHEPLGIEDWNFPATTGAIRNLRSLSDAQGTGLFLLRLEQKWN